ncbi:NUDIX hydrolase [Dyadobacter sediminis]|uniref:NUDIX hydrolase n=1 Tax=Dyadobacter sediminis TaxID=1493691 RepID=A0A5R9KE93_9BACT|nr:NUDIX hydrolase [Dyadobacter sediminis]TLU94439.1 NUDIX hydrolase [Dyadobacter sediminis]GGB91214.1 DNA mismatch repair protein MutT [Dyadobacter sediminis]
MISLPVQDSLFNYRVAGVAILNGKVLMHKTPSDHFWSLPGGRAELFEFSQDTLRREMQEETGMLVQVGKMLWISENFFRYNGIRHHEIGFYFEMEIPDLKDQTDFSGSEGQEELLFKWLDAESLHSIKIYPEFLAAALAQNPLETGHFTSGFTDLDGL